MGSDNQKRPELDQVLISANQTIPLMKYPPPPR